MQPIFRVNVVQWSTVSELDGSWSAQDYLAMLDQMDFGDASALNDDELREMCLMWLQDLEPTEAAAFVLKHRLGDCLNGGQIKNCSVELLDEKLWEEYADMDLHERMFHVGSLLHAAFPQSFPEPDAVRVSLELQATNAPARKVTETPLAESFVVRLLADGMPEEAVLHRLFDDQLAGNSFPEADDIIWNVNVGAVTDDTVEFEVISSAYWLDTLREVKSFDSSAYADEPANAKRTVDSVDE